MKEGDEWNWAFVTSAILVLCVHSFMLDYRITTEAVGGHMNRMAIGFAGVLFLIWGTTVALAITGGISLGIKSRKPIIGAAIGAGIYFPVLLASGILGGVFMLILGIPMQYGVFILPIGVLIWGFLRTPKNSLKQFHQYPSPLPHAPAGHSESEG